MGALWYIVAAGFLWGLAPIFTRGLFAQGITALQVAMMRGLLATVVLLLLALMGRRDLFKTPPKKSLRLIVTGAISMGVMYLTYPLAMELLDVSLAAVFLYTAPIYVSLFFAIFGEDRLKTVRIISLGLIITGAALTCGVFSTTDLHYTPLGLLVGIVCGMSYGMVTIFRKTVQKDASSLEVLLFATLGATLALLLFCPLSSVVISKETLLLFLANSIVSTLLPLFFYMRGLERGVSGAVASSVASCELLLVVGCGTVLFHEPLTIERAVGILFVFLGTIVASKS